MDLFLLLFLTFVIYFIILLIIKKIELGKIKSFLDCNNCCPDCNNSLSRIQRKTSDYLLNYITLRFFKLKRYICANCGWEGIKWDENFTY